MSLPELHTHTFILKIWQEEPADGDMGAVWRGHITHVLSERRKYLNDLQEIAAYLEPYLKEMGVEVEPLR